jgi:hypothetical protein
MMSAGVRLACAFALASASRASAPTACTGKNNTGCTMHPYASGRRGDPKAADAGACCALCLADAKCKAWRSRGP